MSLLILVTDWREELADKIEAALRRAGFVEAKVTGPVNCEEWAWGCIIVTVSIELRLVIAILPKYYQSYEEVPSDVREALERSPIREGALLAFLAEDAKLLYVEPEIFEDERYASVLEALEKADLVAEPLKRAAEEAPQVSWRQARVPRASSGAQQALAVSAAPAEPPRPPLCRAAAEALRELGFETWEPRSDLVVGARGEEGAGGSGACAYVYVSCLDPGRAVDAKDVAAAEGAINGGADKAGPSSAGPCKEVRVLVVRSIQNQARDVARELGFVVVEVGEGSSEERARDLIYKGLRGILGPWHSGAS